MDLLERAHHLRQLNDLLCQAAHGRGQVVVVGGEAGAGKTALVRAFCAQAAGRARIMVGACDALTTPRVLGPLLDIAHLDPRLERHVFQGNAADLVSSTMLAILKDGPRPALLIIEDIHWADAATLDLLRYLGRRIGDTRALVVVTYRDDEVGAGHPLVPVLGYLATSATPHRISLSALSLIAVTTLAAGSGLDPIQLYAQTGGNPFFVAEVVAAGGGLPPAVHDAVLARAARLPAAARALLDEVAVVGSPIGSPIEVDLLCRVLAPDAADLDQCLASGMLQYDGQSISFRHELARAAILTTISPLRRRDLHVSVLKVLEEAERVEIECGSDLATAAGLEHLVVRGHFRLGVAHGEQYRFARAEAHFSAAIDVATAHNLDHPRLLATSWLAYCRMFQGQWDSAVELAISALSAGDRLPIVSVTALHVLGLIRARRGEAGAMAVLDEALALATGRGGPARIGPIRAARAEAAWLRGDLQAVLDETAAAYEPMVQHGQEWYAGALGYWRWRAGGAEQPPAMIAAPFAWQVAGEWERAATAWDDLGCPYEAACARAEANTEATLRSALVTFDRLGAAPAMREARRRWRALGLPGMPRGLNRSTRANPAHLTRRQVQILALVVEGCANQEIATRLFLSKRTVEAHLFTLFAKLGVDTRDEAARLALQRGLAAGAPGELVSSNPIAT